MMGSSAVTMPLAGTCTTGAVIRVEIVDVGLAVRHDDHLRGVQMIAHHLLQRLRRPVLVKIDLQPLLFLGLRQHLPHLRQDRAWTSAATRRRRDSACRGCRRSAPRPSAAAAARPPARSTAPAAAPRCRRTPARSRAPFVWRRSTKLKSCSISTRNGMGVGGIEIEARNLHRPGRQLHDAGWSAPFRSPAASQVTAAGARSVLNIVVPSVRHTNTASRRSSAVIFAR